MLTNLIENRGREFSNLLKIGDYLARSLRENVELFFVDGDTVTYITESGNVITGSVVNKPSLGLVNIEVEDASILEDKEAFDNVANKKISTLLSDLLENDFGEADNSFDKILSLYETKMSYDRIKTRLHEKTQRFGDSTKIVSSEEFKRVLEVKDKLIEFLKENKQVTRISEIRNAVKLAGVVSKAFNVPKVSLDQLKENRKFMVKIAPKDSIYEHLCRQELVAKEILENKNNFEKIWADNEDVSELASLVFSTDDNKVRECVAKIITDVPYFAISTKKQISTVVKNALSLSEVKVPEADIKLFVSKIYEMKKPVRDHVVKLLNEKYNININALTEVPTYSNLIKTESVIMNVLGKIAPKGSVLKKTLLEFANSLPVKNGAEAIDLVDFLFEVFDKAEISESLNETNLMSYLDFNKVADDLGKIGQVLKMITPMIQGGGAGMPQPGMAQPGMGLPQPGMAAPSPADPLPDLPQEDPLGQDPMNSDDEAGIPSGGMEDPQDVADGIEQGGEGDPMGMEDPMGMGDPMGMEEPKDIPNVGSDELSDLVASVEDVLTSLKAELGMDIDNDFEEYDPSMEDQGGFEGEESGEGVEFEEEGDEGGGEFEGEGEGEGEEEEEEEVEKKPNFKKKEK